MVTDTTASIGGNASVMAPTDLAPSNQSSGGGCQAATNDKNRLENLAPELQIRIARYLDGSGLKSMHAVCDSLSNNTVDLFAERFFQNRHHHYVPSSLKALLEMSSEPVFACRIEVIEIETRRLDSLMRFYPATFFLDMQQQFCSILKNLSKYGVCRRIRVTPGPRSTHHNAAINAICRALIESKYPLQALSCTFWGPLYYPQGTSGHSQDECPFDLPADELSGLQRLLSSLTSLEISMHRHMYEDNNKLSCRWLAQALASCNTLPELIINGEDKEWSDWMWDHVREVPLHTLTIKDISGRGVQLVESFVSHIRGSLRHLRLSRVAGSGYAPPWETLLPRVGQYLTLDSIKLEELVNIKGLLTSKPYGYESSGGSEQIRAHLLQIGNGEHDWEPREDQD